MRSNQKIGDDYMSTEGNSWEPAWSRHMCYPLLYFLSKATVQPYNLYEYSYSPTL